MDPRIARLAEEYRRQRDGLLAAFPDLAEDEEALTDTLDGITDTGDFIARICRQAREDEAMASGLATMLRDMGERKSRLMSRAEKRRAIAMALMNAIGERRIVRPDMTITVQPGRMAVVVTDDTALPDSLCKVERRPDKPAIREALERGEAVAGAVLSNGTETLTIRTK